MNAPFRFVHTADLHLDSPLKSLARRDADLAEHVENATRQALVRTIDLCIEENVHALLIAGDIYDNQHPSVATVGFFQRQLARLIAPGIRVYLIRGNHDTKLSPTQELPENVVEFMGNKKSDLLKSAGVLVHGVSFKESHATESALHSFKAPDEKYLNIALLHTSLGGSEGHDVYAPCSVAELDSLGFNYWALGHIHKREVAGKDSTIVMPGNPQGRHMGETGPKTVSLVTLTHNDCEIQERVVGPVRFERMPIALTWDQEQIQSPSLSLKQLKQQFMDAALALKSGSPAIDRWIIRLEVSGDPKTLYYLKSDEEDTLETIKLCAEELHNVHIDKITYRATATDKHLGSSDHDVIHQLRAVVMNNLDDDHLASISEKEFDDLVKFLPTKALKDQLQDTPEKRLSSIQAFQREGAEELLSMIQLDRGDDE